MAPSGKNHHHHSKRRPLLMRAGVTATMMVCLWNDYTLLYDSVEAFTVPVATSATATAARQHNVAATATALAYKRHNNNDNTGDNESTMFDPNDFHLLQERIDQVKVAVLEEDWRRPPNASIQPQELVEQILNGLWNCYDPLPNAGFKLVLQTATKPWRTKILQSIGVPKHHVHHTPSSKTKTATTTTTTMWNNEYKYDAHSYNGDLLASALGAAMERPHNQFALLIGDNDNDDDADAPQERHQQHQQEFRLDFPPCSMLNFEDGTCWVECRLRDITTDELLVITGWNLVQREGDGAWLVDSVDWQDFRDEFRPGVGREEWMRLCQ